uniref:hypothetical protein n=5 Tax=Aliarcobacter sp. TaxID=2321116 RepID=UPI004047B74F
MIDGQNSDNNSTFSLFTNKELNQQDDIRAINFIIEKYNILENENQLISSTEKTYLYIINFILDIKNKEQLLEKDLEELFLNNIFLREKINHFLEKKLFLITKNDSNSFFKEMSIIFEILSVGTNEKIFNSYSNYNFDNISNLFRYYESRLKFLFQENKELFDLTFNSYTILLKTFTQLCTINSIDIIRKKNINYLIELMTETINILKYTVALDENKLCKINNIQGKYLYYFSHIEKIIINKDNLKESFEKYILCLERQEDGFALSKNNHFGNENFISESEEFLILKNNTSTLILKLIKQLKRIFKNHEFYDFEDFQKILRFYYSKFSFTNKKKTIQEFEKDLLNSLFYNYSNNHFFLKENITYHTIIENFIFLEKEFDNKNLETIYRILFFASDIPIFKYNQIAEILADSNVIANDYYEFFKLAVFDLVIYKLTNIKYNKEIEDTLKKIFTYINKTKISFHLLSIYSKIYLSFSYFYSKNNLDMEKAKSFYCIFIQINGIEILEKEYKNINHKIITNIKMFDKNLNHENALSVILENHLLKQEFQLKKEIENITLKALKSSKNSINEIQKLLINLIENDIFHKLASVEIIKTNVYKEKDNKIETIGIKINENLTLQLKFSNIYKINFYSIYKHYKDFIENDICKILDSIKEETILKHYFELDDEFDINY